MPYLKTKERKLIFFILLFSAWNFYYQDSGYISNQAMDVWRALFAGDIFVYYKEYGSAFGIILNLVSAIWLLPMYLIEVLVKINPMDFFYGKMWYKLFLFLTMWFSGEVLKKIALELKMEEKTAENVFFMYITGFMPIASACVNGQVDIIGVLFTFLAFLYLLRKDDKKFILFLILAGQCKYFPLFILIPVVLYKEKKVWKALLLAAAPLLVSVVLNIPFVIGGEAFNENVNAGQETNLSFGSLVGAGAEENTTLDNVVGKILQSKIIIMGNQIPMAFLFFFAVCIWAFIKSPSEDEKDFRWYLYFGFLGILSILLSMHPTSYRMVFLAPFFALFFFLKRENQPKRLFLETAVMVLVSFGFLLDFYWCFDLSAMSGMLCDTILPMRKFAIFGLSTIRDWFQASILSMFHTFFYGAFVVWSVGFAIYHYPGRAFDSSSKEEELCTKNSFG